MERGVKDHLPLYHISNHYANTFLKMGKNKHTYLAKISNVKKN